jgi:hypothetical protein
MNSGSELKNCQMIGRQSRRWTHSPCVLARCHPLTYCKTSSMQGTTPCGSLMCVNEMPHKVEISPQPQFCSLEYREQRWNMAASPKSTVVFLALRDEEGTPRFLVHPELRTVVLEEDLAYIEDLLSDFLQRAMQDPAALFKQISSVGVGPLVTKEVGSSLSECPAIECLSSKFMPLQPAN